MTAGDTYPAASVILVDPRGRVLLLLRDDYAHIPWPNCWDLIGGLLEEGESLEESVLREAEEECGYRTSELREFAVFEVPNGYRGATCEDHIYYALIDMPLESLRKGDEGQALRFFAPDEIGGERLVWDGGVLRAFFASPQYAEMLRRTHVAS